MTYHHPSLQELQEALGNDYAIETIDEESILCRDLGNGFHVMIRHSEEDTDNIASVYLGSGATAEDSVIVRSVRDIRNEIGTIQAAVESLYEYSNEMLANGFVIPTRKTDGKKNPSLRELKKALGREYLIKNIDMEKCLYRDFGNGFNVEVSGCSQANSKDPANIYLWFGTDAPDCIMVKSMQDVGRDADSIKEAVESLYKYSKELLAQGYDTRDKIFYLKNPDLKRKPSSETGNLE